MDCPIPVGPIIDHGVTNPTNINRWNFRKKFNFNIKSTKYQYFKKDLNDGTQVMCNSYIHSIPYHQLFFYITEKEFDDIVKTNHTAKVSKVSLKITNLGNRTPFITGTNTVSYANANSQTTIAIWEGLEGIGPVTLGNNITPETLYGKNLKNLKASKDIADIPVADYGATSQAKVIDNRVKFTFYTDKKLEDGVKVPLNDNKLYLPPLLMMAKTFYNATNSIGTIYEKEYVPKDGTFHIVNNAWHENGFMSRKQSAPYDVNMRNGTMAEAWITRIHQMYDHKYENLTIDNLMFSNIDNNCSGSMGSTVGIGVVPLLNNDGKIENSVFNFMVETYIEIEGQSFGTNLLMSPSDFPQPNTYAVGLITGKRKFHNAFGVAGKPIVGEHATERAEPPENDDEFTEDNELSMVGHRGETRTVLGSSIPGQRRITGKMNKKEREAVVGYNRLVREQWEDLQKENGVTVEWKQGKNYQYGIPENPMTIPAATDNFWKEVFKVGTPALN